MNASVSFAGLICFGMTFVHAQESPLNSANRNVGVIANESSNSLQSGNVVTIDPNQLVLNAIHQSVWGPPLECKVHQSSRDHGQLVVVSGEYKASGGGSGHFRYTSRVSSGETTLDTIQVSDGRLMYTKVGTKETRRCVVIDQVRKSLGNAIEHAELRPDVSIYLAIGGHAELLRSLYHRYRWYKAESRKIDGIDVWQLVGTIRTERPKVAGNTPLDEQTMRAIPPDSNMPEDVTLTLGRSNSTMPYFPYRVEYFRRMKSADGRQTKIVPVSKLVHSEPMRVVVSDKDFVYKEQENVDDTYETDLYMPAALIAGSSSLTLK